jgi:hypothetical protein
MTNAFGDDIYIAFDGQYLNIKPHEDKNGPIIREPLLLRDFQFKFEDTGII